MNILQFYSAYSIQWLLFKSLTSKLKVRFTEEKNESNAINMFDYILEFFYICYDNTNGNNQK